MLRYGTFMKSKRIVDDKLTEKTVFIYTKVSQYFIGDTYVSLCVLYSFST